MSNKSTPLIFQDFSIAGIRKQWEYQQYQAGKLPALQEFYTINGFDTIGCKTETRRTRGLDKIDPDMWECKYEPEHEGTLIRTNLKDNSETLTNKIFPAGAYCIPKQQDKWNIETYIKCPYGKIGDEIWVKEAYDDGFIDINGVENFAYKANVDNPEWLLGHEEYKKRKWKNPMFMPKRISRIKLDITGLSIERLHDITEEGAIREGITGTRLPSLLGGGMVYHNQVQYVSALDTEDSAIDAFNRTWINLHGQESWNKNPWVWVIQFTVKELKQ